MTTSEGSERSGVWRDSDTQYFFVSQHKNMPPGEEAGSLPLFFAPANPGVNPGIVQPGASDHL